MIKILTDRRWIALVLRLAICATMRTTFDQHQTRVDREAGSFRYDCVGFVSYVLKQAAPKAWESVFKGTGIEKRRRSRSRSPLAGQLLE